VVGGLWASATRASSHVPRPLDPLDGPVAYPSGVLPVIPEPIVPPGGPRRIRRPLRVTPPLRLRGYVFPVYGGLFFVDTFGAPRGDIGFHHGVDIFAPAGSPLLAAAGGTVFAVGWNRVGGNRLWS